MKLILTSSAYEVLHEAVHYLPFSPVGKTVAFIPTAANLDEDPWWVEADRVALTKLGFILQQIDLAKIQGTELSTHLEKIDLIFVCGGNTFYLLQEMRKSGFSEMLPSLLAKEIPYIGSSAGTLVMGPTLDTIGPLDDASKAPELENLNGFGFIPFVPFVHFGGDEFRTMYVQTLAECYLPSPSYLTLSDKQFLVVEDKRFQFIEVSS